MAVANNNEDSSNSDHLAIDIEVVPPRVEEDDEAEKKVYRIIEFVAKNMAGVGTVTSTGAGSIITAGAGSVSVSGGTGGWSVNTSSAGSVNTYTGALEAADDSVEEDCADKIPWAVGVLGGLADGAAIAAALYKSPRGAAAHGGEVAYRVGLLSVLAAGVVEMVGAFWMSRDKNRRGTTGKKILYASICTLLLGMALDGVAIVLKK